MKTYYKPTQVRGKRVIFTSVDPAEHKRRTVATWVAAAIVVLRFCVFAVVVWFAR
jgi:hypothetical protein